MIFFEPIGTAGAEDRFAPCERATPGASPMPLLAPVMRSPVLDVVLTVSRRLAMLLDHVCEFFGSASGAAMRAVKDHASVKKDSRGKGFLRGFIVGREACPSTCRYEP